MQKKKPVSKAIQPNKPHGKNSAGASVSKNDKGKKWKDYYYLIFLGAFIFLISIIRYRLVDVPFERDEGEYAYIGSLYLHGVAPFNDAYTMKLPGTPFMYALLMLIFGHSSVGVHTGMIFINAGTMLFLFLAFKKIMNPFIGLATATIYGLLALGIPFYGFAAHATHFICFFSAPALLILAAYMKTSKKINVFFFGLMLGMAFLMKQQSLFLIIFGALFLFIFLKTIKKQSISQIIKILLLFSLGVIIPYLVVLLTVILAGQFRTFWLWTVIYASKYDTSVKSLSSISFYFNQTFLPSWQVYNYFWVLAAAGILVLFWMPYTRLQKIFILLYIVVSACVVSSGFYFRQHYFIALLPALGLLIAIFIEFIFQFTPFPEGKSKLKSMIPPGILALVLGYNLFTGRGYYFNDISPYLYTPSTICNLAYWGNPFNEAPAIAKYLKENTSPGDKIAVFGSEPEIYFYADRRAATGYLYMYPLMEDQPYNLTMQQDMKQEIEKNKPAYIVFCDVMYSWLPRPNSPNMIFNWGFDYTSRLYTPVGEIDFFQNRGWIFYMENNLKYHKPEPKPDSFIIIFKRNQS